MSRYFSLPEALALLPEIATDLETAVELKQQAEDLETELREVAMRIQTAGGADVDPVRFSMSKIKHRKALETVQEKLRAIQAQGVLVKDLDSGLIDFPALLEGREVYLCWKLGEETIGWWHSVESGFAGRRPITPETVFGGGPTPRPN